MPVIESLPIPFSQAAPIIVLRAWKEEQIRVLIERVYLKINLKE